MSVIGNVTLKALSTPIDDTLGALPDKSSAGSPLVVKVDPRPEIVFTPKDSPQCGVVFGQPEVSRLDPDSLPMVALNSVLEGKPFTSRLWLEAREKRGLVYGLQTSLMNWNNASLLTGQFEADNQKVQEVIQLVQEEWKRLKNKGLPKLNLPPQKRGY